MSALQRTVLRFRLQTASLAKKLHLQELCSKVEFSSRYGRREPHDVSPWEHVRDAATEITETNRFLSFSDLFLDNIVSDWMAQDQITKAIIYSETL